VDAIGAAIVVPGWIVESLIFKWYVDSIENFRTAVGSLAVVLFLISYLYIASIILLVGIESTSCFARRATTPSEACCA
jgi:uncharacterized BrkB/YihY/UPF0761 family membrane protein